MSHLLVVQKNPSSRNFLCNILKSAGHEVSEASDEREALRLATERPVDLIITDLFHASAEKLVLSSKVRADRTQRSLPVIVYSDLYGQLRGEKLARPFGADALIVSPKQSDVLLEIVNSLLNLRRPQAENAVAPEGASDTFSEVPFCSFSEQLSHIFAQFEEATKAPRASQRLVDPQRRALDAAANGIVIADLEGNILWANNAFEVITGHPLREVIGQNPHFLKSGLQSNSFYEEMWATILRGEPWHGELVNKRKDGSLYSEEMTITPIKDRDGEVVNFIAIKKDVSARKKYEQELAESRRLYHGVFHNHHIIMLLADAENGQILDANPAAAAFYGKTISELTRLNLNDLCAKPDEDLLARLSAFTRTPRTHVDVVQKAAEGRECAVEIFCARIESISRPAFFCVVNDVESRKQLERELLRAQRLESVGTLASGIAHDINNILAPIMLATGLLKLESVSSAQMQALNAIENSAKRGADLVRQVLSFARGIGGERVLVDLRHVARDIAKIIGDTFPKNICFNLKTPQEPALVEDDPTQMHQLLMNLCVNARDAMPCGGHLGLLVAEQSVDELFATMTPGATPGTYVRITVSDTGCGIPPDIQDRIFEPFFTTKDPGHGTGLGLSTVATIVKSHNGFLRLKSYPGEGSFFQVCIPKVRAASVVSDDLDAQTEMACGSGELILLVDDEEYICQVAGGMLTKFGYYVVTARNGVEAVKQATHNPGKIALAIVDLAMPIVDGPATIIALRSFDPMLPIIVSSGHASERELATVRQLGVKILSINPTLPNSSCGRSTCFSLRRRSRNKTQ